MTNKFAGYSGTAVEDLLRGFGGRELQRHGDDDEKAMLRNRVSELEKRVADLENGR